MFRTAVLVTLGLCASTGAQAQPSTPEAYTLKVVGKLGDVEMTTTIVRDGARERVERRIGPSLSATLYDFAAKRVYWIGWSGAGSCSSGRLRSARAPVEEDPVTGTAETLAKLTEGRSRKGAGTGTVAGLAARIEAFVGGTRPTGREADDPWPTRVWLAEDGGYLLKLEAEGKGGKPVTVAEVTQLVFGKPQGAALEPPADCVTTNSEMDEAGNIRGSGSTSVTAEAGGTAELGAGASPKGAGPAKLAKIDGLSLSIGEQPDDGPCGKRLHVIATLSADGPATIKYTFRPSAGGLRFTGGESGTVILDAAGGTTINTDATLTRSAKGTMRLQGIVQGTKGHNGPLKSSEPLPFDVKCR